MNISIVVLFAGLHCIELHNFSPKSVKMSSSLFVCKLFKKPDEHTKLKHGAHYTVAGLLCLRQSVVLYLS